MENCEKLDHSLKYIQILNSVRENRSRACIGNKSIRTGPLNVVLASLVRHCGTMHCGGISLHMHIGTRGHYGNKELNDVTAR